MLGRQQKNLKETRQRRSLGVRSLDLNKLATQSLEWNVMLSVHSGKKIWIWFLKSKNNSPKAMNNYYERLLLFYTTASFHQAYQ